MAKPVPRVYLSYASSEKRWARQLAESLAKVGVDVWDPAVEMLPGALPEEAATALRHADALVVLISPSSMKSESVRRELQFALGEPKFQNRLIPVMVKRTPSDDVPWILRHIEWAEGDPARVAEQIAATLETGKRREPRAQAR